MFNLEPPKKEALINASPGPKPPAHPSHDGDAGGKDIKAPPLPPQAEMDAGALPPSHPALNGGQPPNINF